MMADEIPYPIPKESRQAFLSLGERPRNPGLIFERFAPNWGAGFEKERFKKDPLTKSELKKRGLEAARLPADTAALSAYFHRWQTIAAHIHAETFALKTDWRFIPGLGRKGPLDVGFSFHRYGFPILPGSSVKGLARAWAFFQIVEKTQATNLEELEKTLLADGDDKKHYEDWKAKHPSAGELADDFRTIFGTTAQAGGAIFLDAIPASPPTLELDVMNPHFPKYYSGETEYPTDSQNPIPVFFLTVAAGQEFHFAVGWRGKKEEEDKMRPQATNWLKAGLQTLGAGAKTSAGYGYFGQIKG